MRVVRVETVYSFDRMLQDIREAPVLALDTETVGKVSYDMFLNADVIEAHGIVKATLKRDELQALYRTQYKGRDKRVNALIQKHDRSVNKAIQLAKNLRRTARKHPGGLQFHANYLGMVQVATEDTAYLVRADNLSPSNWEQLGLILNDVMVLIIFNAQFDWKQLARHTEIRLHCRNLHDAFIAERLLTNGTKAACGLKDTLQRRYGVEIVKDEETRISNWRGVWTSDMVSYSVCDVSYLHRLKDDQRAELRATGLMETYEQERRLLPINCQMEMAGVGIDLPYIADVKAQLILDVKASEVKCRGLFGDINLNSPSQLLEALKKAGLPVENTDKKTLNKFASNPFVAALLEYRQYYRFLTTYMQAFTGYALPMPGNHHRIFASFNPSDTVSGRWSSSNPNFQNIPARPEYRRLVIPAPGMVFVQADTAQIELRVLAELSQDPVLLQAFADGDDPHLIAASLVFGIPRDQVTKLQRARCKAVGFGIIYGQTSFGLSNALGIDERAAQDLIDAYMRNFYRVKRWIEQTKQEVRELGYMTTIGGRRRNFDGAKSKVEWIVKAAERAAVNHKIQGTAADGMKESVIHLDTAIEASSILARPVLVCHDEILIETPLEHAPVVCGLVRQSFVSGYKKYIKTVRIEVGDKENGYQPQILNHWGDK
jgi:DNA polymerase I-like protein with 3'-5' exonuclease and polymerase domains